MSDRLCFLLSLVAFCALLAFVGCGADDLVIPGSIPPTETGTPGATPGCLPSGDACVSASDCCSGSCVTFDGTTFQCQ
jgi:hypothetical protein